MAQVAKRRQISDAEKKLVLERQGLNALLTATRASADELEYDHVWAYSEDGPTEIENIAAVCKRHNREKRALTLGEYRDRIELRRFFEGART